MWYRTLPIKSKRISVCGLPHYGRIIDDSFHVNRIIFHCMGNSETKIAEKQPAEADIGLFENAPPRNIRNSSKPNKTEFKVSFKNKRLSRWRGLDPNECVMASTPVDCLVVSSARSSVDTKNSRSNMHTDRRHSPAIV